MSVIQIPYQKKKISPIKKLTTVGESNGMTETGVPSLYQLCPDRKYRLTRDILGLSRRERGWKFFVFKDSK